jgi:citrate lyase subunit beta/citryl-CoA lyase
MYVRINALTTPYAKDDIAALGSENLNGLMLPKVESANDLITFGGLLTDLEKESGLTQGSLEILSICETAKGLEEIYPIVSVQNEPKRDMIVAFGAADYTLDLGISLTKEGRELDYPRTRIPIACRAADIVPPLDTPWMVDLKDMDGLLADVQKAKAYGFQGKIVIHPNQIQPCHEVFTPTKAEIEYARKIVETFEAAERDGKAAIQIDGKFIDYPVVERARRTIELSRAIEDK